MRVVWQISVDDGTKAKNFTINTDESIPDVNLNGISFAFYSDDNWTIPTDAPTEGTMTFSGKNYFPNGVLQDIPVAISGDTTTNVLDFSDSSAKNGFSFTGKCMYMEVELADISTEVNSIEIIFDRYTG